jgi:hypothetical protein
LRRGTEQTAPASHCGLKRKSSIGRPIWTRCGACIPEPNCVRPASQHNLIRLPMVYLLERCPLDARRLGADTAPQPQAIRDLWRLAAEFRFNRFLADPAAGKTGSLAATLRYMALHVVNREPVPAGLEECTASFALDRDEALPSAKAAARLAMRAAGIAGATDFTHLRVFSFQLVRRARLALLLEGEAAGPAARELSAVLPDWCAREPHPTGLDECVAITALAGAPGEYGKALRPRFDYSHAEPDLDDAVVAARSRIQRYLTTETGLNPAGQLQRASSRCRHSYETTDLATPRPNWPAGRRPHPGARHLEITPACCSACRRSRPPSTTDCAGNSCSASPTPIPSTCSWRQWPGGSGPGSDGLISARCSPPRFPKAQCRRSSAGPATLAQQTAGARSARALTASTQTWELRTCRTRLPGILNLLKVCGHET